MRFGIIGLRWGQHYIRNIKELGHEVTIVSSKSDRSNSIVESHTMDWRDVCESPHVDTVVIAAPPELHYRIAKHALNCDKNVICEKPFTVNLLQAMELQKMTQDKGVSFFVNYIHTWNPTLRALRGNVSLKDLNSVGSCCFGMGPDRDHTYSVFEDWASHNLSIFFCLFPEVHGLLQTEESFIQKKNSVEGNGLYRVVYEVYYEHSDLFPIDFYVYCGNGESVRKTGFGLVKKGVGPIVWEDDYKTNSLRNMLVDFIENGGNNLDLALKVTRVLKNTYVDTSPL